jgi:hypothetical protein
MNSKEKVILLIIGRDLAEAQITIHPKKIEGVQTLEVEFENGRKEQIQLGK